MLSTAMCALALGAERPAFQSLRHNEDWSLFQASSQQADWLHPARFIPLQASFSNQIKGNYGSVIASFRI